jgi:lambda family phage portal protein
MLSSQIQQLDLFARAMGAMAALGGKPLLYGPDGRALAPTVNHTFRREAAKKTGNLANWRPQQVFTNQAEAMERAEIVKRSIDLANNDPHAAGIIDTFAATVVGPGLTPHPSPDPDALGLSDEAERRVISAMRAAYNRWAPFADVAGRLHAGQIHYLTRLSLLRYGEFFVLLPMLEDAFRPYSLACQVIHPLRVKTPIDLVNAGNIRDGIELGEYGEAVAVWIKKSGFKSSIPLPDIAVNFLRVPTRVGHRWNVLHGFVTKEPEQVRGWPFFAPAITFFRHFSDLLSAELISNVVTAALTYFIEVQAGQDPFAVAQGMATRYATVPGPTGAPQAIRHQETYPGAILYGNAGEKPHLLSAARPGTTFEPFTKTVKKSIALACGMPYVVAFKDVEGTSYAGFRAAMLDAWRVFSMDRVWHGRYLAQPLFTMLMEEAYLRGELPYPAFYRDMHELTRCEWRGAPKGNIEPVKEIQAEILAINNNLKTREAAIIENGFGDPRRTFRQLEEEANELIERGLPPWGDPGALAPEKEEEETDAGK